VNSWWTGPPATAPSERVLLVTDLVSPFRLFSVRVMIFSGYLCVWEVVVPTHGCNVLLKGADVDGRLFERE